MAEKRHLLLEELARARQDFAAARARIGALEASLMADVSTTDTSANMGNALHAGAMDVSFAITYTEREAQHQEAEAAVKRYVQQLEILRKIDAGIIEGTSIQDVVDSAITHIRALFDCQQANVMLFDLSTNEVIIFSADQSSPSQIVKGQRYPLSADFFNDFGDKTVSIIDDILILPQSRPTYRRVRAEGLRSSLRALLQFRGQSIGVLILNSNTPGYFTAEHQDMIVEIANQLAIAIGQLQLSESLARHSQSLEHTRQFLQTTLDAFPANTAVLDSEGTILMVNLPWSHFATDNGFPDNTNFIGSNYLTICDTTTGAMAGESRAAAAGIRAVIAGQLGSFNLEYPCPSPTEDRWYMMRVTPFAEPTPRRVVVAHIDITDRKLAEQAEREQRVLAEALRNSLAVLTNAMDVETALYQILAYSATVIPSEAGSIILFDGDRRKVAYSRGFSPEANAFFENHWFSRDSGIYSGETTLTTSAYLVQDTQSTPGWSSFSVTAWIRSSVGVPILVQGEPIGLLVADSGSPNHFQQKDMDNLQVFARYAALALESVRHIDQLEQRVIRRTAELQAAKEHVEAILNNSVHGIVLLSFDLRIQQVNAAFNQLFACDSTDYFGRSLLELIDDAVFNPVTTALQSVIDGTNNKRIEARAKRKDGTGFYAELGIGLAKDNSFVCTIQDITERKAQERQLRYQASLQENVNDAVISTDMTYHIMSWNPAAERIYGWQAGEAVGRPSSEILRTEYASEAEHQGMLQTVKEKGWWQGEVVQHHKYGHIRHVFRSITLIKDAVGIGIGTVSINYDITDRKRAENELAEQRNQLRTLIDTVPDLIYIKDTQHRFVLCNQAFARARGLNSPDELINQTDYDYFPDEMAGRFSERETEVIRTGEPMIDEEEFLNGYQGFTWALTNKFPLRNLNGEIIGLACTTRDITARKEADSTLQLTLKKEMELGELKSRFVSIASHEFRTPLAAILATAETLTIYRDRMDSAQINIRLDKIRQQVNHMRDIMERVLQMARIQAERIEFKPMFDDLDLICQEIVEEFESQQLFQGRLAYSCPVSPVNMYCDRQSIRGVISNLVSNALKYSPLEKQIDVKLTQDDYQIVLSVMDEGIGIPDDDLKHMFEPFYRATNVGTISGTGLGLSIVKQAVEAHHGTVVARSRIAGGTTFTVTFPKQSDITQ